MKTTSAARRPRSLTREVRPQRLILIDAEPHPVRRATARLQGKERDPELASGRAGQDRLGMAAIKQAFDGSRGRHGARKVWHQLRREGRAIARLARWNG